MSTFAEQVEAAIAAHSKWKMHLRAAISTGKSDFQVDTVKKDNACPFGQWLYSGGQAAFPTREAFEDIRGLHAKFHASAAQVLALAVAGRADEASKAMGFGSEFGSVSAALVNALTKARGAAAA
ncbi:MAG: CZB domain-containing protein [Dehalococcoidia bacterium]